MITRFLLLVGLVCTPLVAFAQNAKGPAVVSVLAKELRIYDAPDPQSLPKQSLPAANVPVPAPVIERSGAFIRVALGGQAVWVKSGEVRLSQPVEVASGCASATANTLQARAVAASSQLGGTRGIDDACR